ncbi:hypothetical protein BN946_scf185016.g65 [Trametes cinnabarina]|uniref:Uncharacterized protein n=1 Tax=Pycnoporus cinnabarinus TaxID=5643 RepID=A0A060SNB0_PYCCI|nr:hypothetical protein BN946_scf185016.g65 [Trametes cinnabarina]
MPSVVYVVFSTTVVNSVVDPKSVVVDGLAEGPSTGREDEISTGEDRCSEELDEGAGELEEREVVLERGADDEEEEMELGMDVELEREVTDIVETALVRDEGMVGDVLKENALLMTVVEDMLEGPEADDEETEEDAKEDEDEEAAEDDEETEEELVMHANEKVVVEDRDVVSDADDETRAQRGDGRATRRRTATDHIRKAPASNGGAELKSKKQYGSYLNQLLEGSDDRDVTAEEDAEVVLELLFELALVLDVVVLAEPVDVDVDVPEAPVVGPVLGDCEVAEVALWEPGGKGESVGVGVIGRGSVNEREKEGAENVVGNDNEVGNENEVSNEVDVVGRENGTLTVAEDPVAMPCDGRVVVIVALAEVEDAEELSEMGPELDTTVLADVIVAVPVPPVALAVALPAPSLLGSTACRLHHGADA